MTRDILQQLETLLQVQETPTLYISFDKRKRAEMKCSAVSDERLVLLKKIIREHVTNLPSLMIIAWLMTVGQRSKVNHLGKIRYTPLCTELNRLCIGLRCLHFIFWH